MMVHVTSTVTASAVVRWVRALLLASVALVTGTTAHLGAHGLLPGPLAMAVLLAAGTALCAPLLRRPASTRRVVLLVVLGQTTVHAALTAVAGHHDHDAAHEMTAPPMLWVDRLTDDLSGPHALMALAHGAAAAVVGWWLARGEHAFWTRVRLAGRRLARAVRRLPAPLVAGPPRVVPLEPVLLPPTWHASAPSLRRRGPPVRTTD